MGWRTCRGSDRILLLFYFSANGKLVVRDRLSCRVGLERDVFLFRARQRHGFSRTPAEFVLARPCVAERRIGRSGRQRAVLCSRRAGLDCTGPCLSTELFRFLAAALLGMTTLLTFHIWGELKFSITSSQFIFPPRPILGACPPKPICCPRCAAIGVTARSGRCRKTLSAA